MPCLDHELLFCCLFFFLTVKTSVFITEINVRTGVLVELLQGFGDFIWNDLILVYQQTVFSF